jgi:hypothetical protein
MIAFHAILSVTHDEHSSLWLSPFSPFQLPRKSRSGGLFYALTGRFLKPCQGQFYEIIMRLLDDTCQEVIYTRFHEV